MHDQYDPALYDNLNSYGSWYTTFPNPVYDGDDDDGDARVEEAEITADHSYFPNVGGTYTVRIRYSRWYKQCGLCPWTWDADQGQIGNISQISQYSFGEWNAYRYSNPYLPTYYPTKSQSTTAAIASHASAEMSRTGIPGRAFIRSRAVLVDGIDVTLVPDGQEIEAFIVTPDDITTVRQENARRSKEVFRLSGSYRAIVTFQRRLTAPEFLSHLGPGISVTAFEANGLTGDGYTASLGGPIEELDRMAEQFRDEGVTDFGVVAADVVLANEAAYRRLLGSPLVLVVDLSGEVVARALADLGKLDVIQNDLYWVHAGFRQ